MDEMRKELLKVIGYSDKAVDVLDADLHCGEMQDPTVSVRHQDSCGDVLMLDLRIESDTIHDVAFRIVGCSGLQATASGMAALVIGMSVDKAERIGPHDVVSWLEGIPANKFECAEAACLTLREAIEEYRSERSGEERVGAERSG